MEKKKVLFFIYQMGAGGAARTLLNILNYMDRTKFELILVTLDYNGSYEAYLKSDVKFVKLETKRLRSAIYPLAKVIRKEKPEIVFSTIPNYNLVAILARLLSFTKAKNIVREAALLGEENTLNIKLMIYGVFYRLSSKVISLSKGVKENLVKRYKVKPEHIKVIYNPVDLESIQDHVNSGHIPEEHKHIFTGNVKVIVTAGRLVKDKDQQTLIKAFAKVNSRIDSELIILGEGELEDILRKQSKELGIEHKVHFIGFQNNPYMYFKRADLFVLSSLREGFGHVLVEALATGTPVVSTDCKPGAEEVLNGEEFGKLCEVGNAEEMAMKINEILTLSKKETTEIIDKGIKRADDFDAKRITKQYEEIFIRTIGQEKRISERG